MKKQNNSKRLIKIVIQILLYILVSYYIYQRLSGDWDVFAEIDGFSLLLFLFSVLIFALHSLWNSILWGYMLNSKVQRLSLFSQIDVYLRSHILRYIPGNVIGIFSRSVFNKEHGVPMIKSFFGWCYENFICLLIGSAFSLFIIVKVGQSVVAPNFIPVIPTLFFLIILGVILVLKMDWFESLFRRFILPRLPKKLKDETSLLEFSLIKRLNLFIGFLISWLIYSISFLFLIAAIDPALLSNNFLELISINAFAWSIGYISFVTPSGVGVREWIMIFSLGNFLNFEIGVALMIAILARIVCVLGDVFAFGVFSALKYIFGCISK